jgi:hypothetical protein
LTVIQFLAYVYPSILHICPAINALVRILVSDGYSLMIIPAVLAVGFPHEIEALIKDYHWCYDSQFLSLVIIRMTIGVPSS